MADSTSPVGLAEHPERPSAGESTALEPSPTFGQKPSQSGRSRVVALVIASVLAVFATVSLAGGGWALWKTTVDRDSSGFVSIGSATLRTGTYAIVGDLHGDGPNWLWESSVLGDSRVRATSQSTQPLFIGIARTSDVFRYLHGVGYATIDRFEVRSDTTHTGGPPTGLPASESIWARSTHGAGRQTLRWNSRGGNWSIVFMNANAGANVAVHGDASAKLPILPWVAGVLLFLAVALGLAAAWVFVRIIRQDRAASANTSN